MSPEFPTRIVAERLLLLTEALSEVVLSDRLDEMTGLIDARQESLNQLVTMTLDTETIAILERVARSERDLISLVQRSQGIVTHDLVTLFSGIRQIRAYRNPNTGLRLQETG